MKTETQTAKENVKGCHIETKVYSKYKWYSKKWELFICGETSNFLCSECKCKIKTHKQSCERFLEFLDKYNFNELINRSGDRLDEIQGKVFNKKIKDLQGAIKVYTLSGITLLGVEDGGVR